MYSHFKRAFLVSVVSLCSLHSAVSQTLDLTVKDSVNLAMEQNISLKRSRNQTALLEQLSDHSWNILIPSFSAAVSASFLNEPQTYDKVLNGTLSVSHSINLSSVSAMELAGKQYKAGKISLDALERQIELSVRQMFYSLLYEQEYIELRERFLDTSRKIYEQNRFQFEKGRISELDVLSSRVTYENMIPALQLAHIQHNASLASFKELLGVSLDQEIILKGTLDSIKSLADISPLNERGPSSEILSAQIELDIAETALEYKKRELSSPTLSFEWSYSPLYYGLDNYDVSDWESWNDSGTVRVSLGWSMDSLLPWTAAADSLFGSETDLQDARLALEEAKINSSIRISSYQDQIEQLQSSIQSREAGIELARRSYEQTEEAYKRGTRDFLTLENAGDSLLEAQVNLLSDLLSLISTILNLEYESGLKLGTYSGGNS
ncbi:MAG: TolC family protein [Sphaerochaetaceae bacterium]|nr:TolC family protein [Spirochaetales bacterium]